MEKEQNFNLDDLFRTAAEAYDPPYQDQYWQDAADHIQKKKGNNRRFFLYLFWGAMLSSTMALAGYYWMDSNQPLLAEQSMESGSDRIIEDLPITASSATPVFTSAKGVAAGTSDAGITGNPNPVTPPASKNALAKTQDETEMNHSDETNVAAPEEFNTTQPERSVSSVPSPSSSSSSSTSPSTPVAIAAVESDETDHEESIVAANDRAGKSTFMISPDRIFLLQSRGPGLFPENGIQQPEFDDANSSFGRADRARKPADWNWGIGIKFGASYNLPAITQSLNPNIRVSEEPIITKNGGLDLVLYRNQFFVNTGMLYQSYHTDLDYTYEQYETLQKSIVVDQGKWIIREVIVEVHDSIFIDDPSGPILRIDTISHRIEDSTYIPNTDTLLVEFEDTNQLDHRVSLNHSYVEIPLMVGYEFGKKRFTFGVMTGVSVGLLTRNQTMPSIYNGTEVPTPIAGSYRKVLLNYQVQGRIKYQWNRLGLYSDLFWKTNLNYLYEDNEIINLKYDALGAQIGLFYRF
ncbi:outer membrane beta-barrel protein [bacterium SCSIO 12741]|nr:outer membrane beta-barrel protein [bacterium SCSIO 12741]